jgi:hypothetical protein
MRSVRRAALCTGRAQAIGQRGDEAREVSRAVLLALIYLIRQRLR